MVCYPVYLEIAQDGRCLAHVLELPGCIVRAPTQEEAWRQLPGAIRGYHDWQRRYGEDALTPDEPVEIEVAEESLGFGPFDPGDAAALFGPDREPLMPDELERHCRLMGYSRADLLALIQDLPDSLLDWQPDPGSFSLRRLLRHLGNAEEWYISRIFPPESLPQEWQDDEQLPILPFLEMERRTALACLRQIAGEQCSQVFFPTQWTDHPEEPWTACKVLRRFIEHERQHTAQARRILDAYRRRLLARLAAERAGLLEKLLNLDERTLTGSVVHGDWTAQDILAHIAGWERWQERTMRSMVAGETPGFTILQDLDLANASFVAERHGQTLEKVLSELLATRARWAEWLESLPVEEFFRSRSYGGHDWTFSAGLLQAQWEHDAHHARRLAAWKGTQERREKSGSGALLLAALDAARAELLAAAALIPAEARNSRLVTTRWTLQDVLGHLADWDWLGADGLRRMASGHAPQVEHVSDIDAWNQAHVEARRGQAWDTVWEDFQAARRALREAVAGMAEAELSRLFPFPWGPEGTPYQWTRIYVDHDRSHARGLRGEKR